MKYPNPENFNPTKEEVSAAATRLVKAAYKKEMKKVTELEPGDIISIDDDPAMIIEIIRHQGGESTLLFGALRASIRVPNWETFKALSHAD